MTAGEGAEIDAQVEQFRTQLGLGAFEPVAGELLDTPEDELPAPDGQRRAFVLGYAVGRSTSQAEAAADAVFTRARRRRRWAEAIACGAGWLLGAWLADEVIRRG